MGIGIVTTRQGRVEGVEFDGEYAGITTFRGIPYAAPPVGERRWRPPEEPQAWDGVRRCDSYGPAAVQTFLHDRHAKEYYYTGTPVCSEDCLYLNVTSGAVTAGEKRPVYIWFHGGGLTNCYSYEPQFNPQEMARKGIVVVTVGHRLSLFGYLALPQLTREQGGRSGNYGFMDELKALDWVTENIAAFGGDPNRITVGGQSGGSLKAAALAATPASSGRVKGVISQSGLKMKCQFRTLESAEQQGRNYLRYIGLDPDTPLEVLRRMSTEEIFCDAPRAVMPGDMICDAELVPFPELQQAIDRYAAQVDFLSGSNLGEADVFAASRAALGTDPVQEYVREIRNERDFRAHFRNLLGTLYDEYDGDRTLTVENGNPWRTARHLAGLGLAGWEGMNFSRNVMLNRLFGAHRKTIGHTGRTFTYYWTHLEPCRPEDYGTERDPEKLLAWHSSELWYAFGSLRPGVPPLRPWQPQDYAVACWMNDYWVNFIKSGDPNGGALPAWPASDEHFGWMELGNEPIPHVWENTRMEKLIRAFVEKEYNFHVR